MKGTSVDSSKRAPVAPNHDLENTGIPPAKPTTSRRGASFAKTNLILNGSSTSIESTIPDTAAR